MRKDEILSKATEYVTGPRAEDYGDALENHELIAEGWNIIMKKALDTHGYLTAMHVALMMDWLKTSRLLHKLTDEDGWVDKCGYSAIGGECAHRSEERSTWVENRLKTLSENEDRQ